MFIFNGDNSTNYLIENAVRHCILPPLTHRSLSVPGRAGVYDFGVNVGAREIEVDVTVKGTSLADFRTKLRNIASWLYQDGLKPLVFSDEPDKTYYARISGSTYLEQIVDIGKGTITFICPDPYAVGVAKSQTFSSGETITNNGTAGVYPIFTVNFSASTSSFKIMKGTQQVYIADNFVVGDSLVIDHSKAFVTKNSLRIINKVDLGAVFFELAPGSNMLTFAPTSNLTVRVEFKEKWL